jgi:hypothetical protein
MQRPDGKPVLLVQDELRDFRLDDPLPSPAEQADQLILWIGSRQTSPGESTLFPLLEVSAWIGTAVIPEHPHHGIGWLLRQAEINPLLVLGRDLSERETVELKMAGWERYEELSRRQINSRFAFMAMEFRDPELDYAFQTHFKNAAKRAGFMLRALNEGQPAGLIDDQLRVALRTSRFVIADLSHGNNGAYWEAGFAEGLGLPVIYTCREKDFEATDQQGRRKVHFDTSHLVTIKWSRETLKEAEDKLTATIRATIPDDANLLDT